MNLIMNKTRNSMNSINVDKLMFIYMNERTLNRPTKMRKKLQFAGIEIDENDLCEMKDRQMMKKVSLRETNETSNKRPASQIIEGNATRTWLIEKK
jgi:hypothetical protein